MRAENFKKWIEEKLSNESCNGKKFFGHDNDRQSNFLEFCEEKLFRTKVEPHMCF